MIKIDYDCYKLIIILRLKCPNANMVRKLQLFAQVNAVFGNKPEVVTPVLKSIIIIWDLLFSSPKTKHSNYSKSIM